MTRIVLVGGGGFAKEVLDLARMAGQHVVGHVAPTPGIVDVPYLGTLDALDSQRDAFDGVVLGFGTVNRATALQRADTIARIDAMGLPLARVISPRACLSSGAQIGPGSVIAHHVIVAVDAVVGRHCMLNNAAQLGHDSVLEDNVALAPMAFVAGGTRVGANSLIGPGALVLQKLTVGAGSVVGVGSVVVRSLPPNTMVIPDASRRLRG